MISREQADHTPETADSAGDPPASPALPAVNALDALPAEEGRVVIHCKQCGRSMHPDSAFDICWYCDPNAKMMPARKSS